MVNILFQHWWGWYIAIYLFLGGMGGGGMLVSYYLCCRRNHVKVATIGAVTSLLLVIIGVGFLILDLEKPEKFYLVFLSPHLNMRSMIFVGSTILTLFIIFGLLYISSIPYKWPQIIGWLIEKLPWYKNLKIANISGLMAAIFGFLTTFYTGVLIGVVKQIPFWNTPALPLLFVASALSTGVVELLLINNTLGLISLKRKGSYIIITV